MLEIVFRNWHFKLLSAVLAFTLWVAVTGEGVIVQDYTVPLDIALRDGYTLLGSYPSNGEVRLRGPETVLRRIDPLRHEMELLVDLSQASPGERTVQLGPDNLVGAPRGVEVAQITPNRLSVGVDESLTREIQVVASVLGQPPSGYHFYGARATPETLTIEGPKSQVQALTRMRTDPINLEGRTDPFVVRVGAVPDSPEVRVLDARLISVQVDVDAAPLDLTLDAVPVVLAGQIYEAAITPSTLRVVLSGPPALLREIGSRQIRAVVDVSGLAPRAGSYHLSPRVEFVDLPASDLARIGVKSVNRESVAVVLSERRISP
jgi:YbbR domain-containing protein